MSTKKKNTNVDTKKKGAAEKSPSISASTGLIPGLSMVASSTSLAPSNNVKKTTGSIASTAKEGSTRKIEEAYEQRVASQMASPKTGRVPTNAQLVEAPKQQETQNTQNSGKSERELNVEYARNLLDEVGLSDDVYKAGNNAVLNAISKAVNFIPGLVPGISQDSKAAKVATALPNIAIAGARKKKLESAGVSSDEATRLAKDWDRISTAKGVVDSADYEAEYAAKRAALSQEEDALFRNYVQNHREATNAFNFNNASKTAAGKRAREAYDALVNLGWGANGDYTEMNKMIENYERVIDAEQTAAINEETAQSFEDHPVASGLAGNAAAILGSPLRGVTAAAESLRPTFDERAGVNTNSPLYSLSNFDRAVTSETLEDLTQASRKQVALESAILGLVGEKTNNPGMVLASKLLTPEVAEWATEKGYGAAKSGAESLLNVSGGGALAKLLGATGKAAGTIAKIVTLPSFGTSAFAQTVQDVQDRGLGRETAIQTGVAAGVAEMLFEELSLDKVWNSYTASRIGKSAMRDMILDAIVGGAAVEGSEEGATTIANMVTDALFNMDFSKNESRKRYYIANGMSEEEAEKKVHSESLQEFIDSVTTGALSGLGMNSGATLGGLLSDGRSSGIGGSVEQSQDNVPQATAQRIEELAAQIQPGTETEVQGESAPIEQPTQSAYRANPEDVVYHAGTFSKLNKAETNGQFAGSNRDTGYFGTGHYFVDGNTINEISTGNYAEKPLTSVDISGYNNLFRADTDEKAKNLHYFLSNLTKYTQGSKRNDTADLYSDYLTAFKGQENIIPYDDFVNRVNGLAEYMQNSNMDDRGDSVSTQFMKSLGYGGVDTRGTNYADTRYGTVIYDVDENSVLQGNVPADQRATTDMLTRSENRNVYDADEDARIQSIFDQQARNAEIEARYNAIYDSTELRENEQHLEELYDERKEVMSIIEDVSAVLRDPEGYVAENNKLLADMGLELSESETAEEVERIQKDFTESLNERMAQLESINQQIAEAESVNDSLQAESNAAWEQARADQNAPEAEEPTYLGAVENSPYELTPEQQADFDKYGVFGPEIEETEEEPIDENQPLIENGQVTRNGVDFIRNRWKPEQKTLKDTPYNKQFLGIRQALTSNNMGKNDGSRQFSWAIASEIRQYLQDRDRTHLENAQIYADYIDNVIAPYEQGKAATITGAGGRTWTVEEGTQNISGRTAALIDQVIADENREVLNDLPDEIKGHIDALESMKDPVFHSTKFALDQLIEEYENAIIRMKVNHESPDGKTFDRITNLATNAGQIIKQQEKQLRNMGYDPEERFTEAYYLEHMYPLIDFFDQTHHEIYDSNLEVDVPVEEDVVPGMEQAQEVEAAPLLNEAFEQEEAQPRPREMAMDIERETGDNDATFAELTIDPETGEEDYERGPNDRPEPGENWEKRYRGAVYEDNDTMKVTQAARNTLYDLPTVKNNPAVQEYMLQLEDDGTFKADVMHNADSVAEAERVLDAAQKLQGNVDGVLEDILSENTTFDEMSPVQQDTLMMGLDMKLEEGLETGDFSGAAELLEKTNQRQHKIGQLLQALAKYTHTASSAITKATTMIDDATQDYVKKHKKGAATNGKLARALETMGNKYADRTTPKQPISHEEMLKRVRNTLEKESASVDELLTDNVIEQITALVESDIPMWQLRDELEHFFNRGEFYTIDESTEQKKARSQKLANALREVTEGKQERVVTEKTVEQIESEIEALLDSEYASIRDEFTDDDISYLANRIKNGAEHAELVDALNQKMATGSMGFTNEELAEVVQLYKEANSGLLTSREEYEAMQKANAILASHMGKGTVMERLNQWRYLSMLSSPSTHMKNIVSNATWSTVTMLKDTLAAGMEAAAEAAGADIERTKSVILPTAKDKALVKEAYDSFDRDVYAEYARGGSKYNDRNEIKQQQKVGSRFVNKASEINSGLLEKEDIFAGRMKYTQALAGYLKANGADASIFSSTDPEDRALLKKAEDYALAEANKATFHEENKHAKALSNLSRTTAEGGMMGLNAVVEGLFPFKKTTANIANQFLYEYNPVAQAFHGVPKAIYNAVNNGGNVAEVIDSAAKGMTGAGLIALGAYLASQGMLVAKGDDDDKDDVLSQGQNYAITWFDKEGDQHYYTVDGIAPTAMLMFIGAELVEKGISVDTLTGITDSFVENSLLSGINNLFSSIAYSIYDKDKTALFTLMANIANSYVSQYFPTVGGKIARSIDKTRRSTYTGETGDTDTVLRYGRQLMNKIPGLSMLNEPRIDAYGNEEENVGGNFFGRLLYNLTSIGYYSKRERDEIQQTIENLDEYAESLEGDARDEMEKQLTDLITAPDKSFGGERLSPEQYTEYSKITGQTAVDVFNGLISNEIFQAMTPEDQAGIMDQMGLFARNLAKREFFGTTSQSYEKLMELYDDRDMDGVMEYLTIKSALDGNTSNAAAVAAVQMSDMSLEDKSYYLSKFITPGKDAQAAIDALGDNGLYYWYSTCSQSTKKEDRYRAIATSGYSDEIKSALTKIVYNSGKDTPADTIPSLDSLLNGTTQDAKGEAIRSESGDEIADQYYSAKDYIKSSADSMGVSTSNTAAQIDGLKQLDVDDETKGYYLETIKGTVSKKALAAGAELGDAGIYYWYTIYTEAQAQYDSSPTKKEVQSVIDASDYPDDVKAALTRANNTKK